jgi:hypothetical protein
MPGEKRWRIVGAFPEGHEKDESEVLYEEIETRIKEEAEIELDITEVYWFSVYKVHTRHVERFSEGRCFLAGDSAHIHTPAGGQGMNTGIQDAYNLAWKLALVIKGAAADTILDTYNEERLPNAKRLLQTTDRMFNLAAGTDWMVNLIRTTVFPPMAKFILSIDAVKKRFFRLISQIGIHYRNSSLSRHDGDDDFAVKAGDRLPYFLMDGRNIYESLRAAKFHLLSFVDEQSGLSEAGMIGAEVESKYANLIEQHVIRLEAHIAELFDSKEPFTVLLRPDNYIAFISAGGSLNGVSAYFKEVIKPAAVGRSSRQEN